MLLAADIGGTKSLLALFDAAPDRPRPLFVEEFATREHTGVGTLLTAFLDRHPEVRAQDVQAACLGIAGPVVGGRTRVTNVGWDEDAAALSSRHGIAPLAFVNDLAALARSIPVLEAAELDTLHDGRAAPGAPRAVIAAGTGLGMGLIGDAAGTPVPVPSEGGHTDFPPRNERETALLQRVATPHGRVQWEDIVSGPGLIVLSRACHTTACEVVPDTGDPAHMPAAISTAALEGRCAACRETLVWFSSLYGSAAANLALIGAAAGGVYLGGGITPKILPILREGHFLAAFQDKPPMQDFLSRIPVRVILTPRAGLLGAAVHAAALASRLR